MNTALAKYSLRSTRFILQPIDQTLVRLSGPHQIPWEEGTQIRNISLTGMAFTAPNDLCPVVGEHIKIEFQVPGSSTKMACYAMVTRNEIYNHQEMIVAVHFAKMTMQQRLVMAQSIAMKLKTQNQSTIKWPSLNRVKKIEWINYTLLTLSMLGFYILFNSLDLISLGAYLLKKILG